MSVNIFDYPPEERPGIAVKKFRIIHGESLYRGLLKYLDLSEYEFMQEYGEQLIGDPTCLNHTITEMVLKRIFKRK